MEKIRIKAIFKEMDLINDSIPYTSLDGQIRSIKGEALLDLFVSMNGKALKDIYRNVLRNRRDKKEMIIFLSSLISTIVQQGQLEFKDSYTIVG